MACRHSGHLDAVLGVVSKGLLVDVDDEHLPCVACVAWGACGVGAWVLVVWVWVRCGCVVSVGVRAVWERGVAVLWSDLAQVVRAVWAWRGVAWRGSGLTLPRSRLSASRSFRWKPG